MKKTVALIKIKIFHSFHKFISLCAGISSDMVVTDIINDRSDWRGRTFLVWHAPGGRGDLVSNKGIHQGDRDKKSASFRGERVLRGELCSDFSEKIVGSGTIRYLIALNMSW